MRTHFLLTHLLTYRLAYLPPTCLLTYCSRKTAENLAVAALVPLEALHLETDAPWCTVKRTHAGHHYTRPLAWPEAKKAAKWEDGHVVKDRCEPCHLVHVLQVSSSEQ